MFSGPHGAALKGSPSAHRTTALQPRCCRRARGGGAQTDGEPCLPLLPPPPAQLLLPHSRAGRAGERPPTFRNHRGHEGPRTRHLSTHLPTGPPPCNHRCQNGGRPVAPPQQPGPRRRAPHSPAATEVTPPRGPPRTPPQPPRPQRSPHLPLPSPQPPRPRRRISATCDHRGHCPCPPSKASPTKEQKKVHSTAQPGTQYRYWESAQSSRGATECTRKHAPRDSAPLLGSRHRLPQEGQSVRARTHPGIQRRSWDPDIKYCRSDRVHAQARAQGSSAIAGIPTFTPEGVTKCTLKQSPRDPTPWLRSRHKLPQERHTVWKASTQGFSVAAGIPAHTPSRGQHAPKNPAPLIGSQHKLPHGT